VVSAGEDVVLPVTLRNDGTDPATGIGAVLSAVTPGVTVTRSYASYPDLAPGESAASLPEAFSFTVGTDVPCGTPIAFELQTFTNEGAWAATFNVAVGAPGYGSSTYESTEVPSSITDKKTITSVIDIAEAATVADVDVELTLTHSNDGDLDIFLIGPDGTRVELSTDNGGDGDDFIGTIFDDEAPISITEGSAPFTGSYRPEGSLAALDGVPVAGTWALEITDDSRSRTGELLHWSLILNTESGSFCAPCSVAAPGAVDQLRWAPGSVTGLEWTPAAGAAFYNVYRGTAADLPHLVDDVVDSCRELTTLQTASGELLSAVPAPGELHWYLVRAGTAGGEGPAGDSSQGPRIQDSGGVCP